MNRQVHFRHCKKCETNFKSYMRAKVCPRCYRGHLFEQMYGELNQVKCAMCHKQFPITRENRNKENCVCKDCFEDVKKGERSLKVLINILEERRENG